MKKSDVRIGVAYQVTIDGAPSHVRLDALQPVGGKWTGTDLDTGRTIHGKNTNGLRKAVGIAPTAAGSLTTTVADVHRQWQALKASNPGTVLLFLVGDYYEAYGEDATVCVDVLGLESTKRFDDQVPLSLLETPMAGFHHARLSTVIPKLVAAGHRVAVCERVQPGESRKIAEKILGLDGKRVTVRQATASDTCSPFDDVV